MIKYKWNITIISSKLDLQLPMQSVPMTRCTRYRLVVFCGTPISSANKSYCHDITEILLKVHHNPNQNKLLRPKLIISLFPLTRPTLSKSAAFFFSFRSKFVLLKIPYFRFVLPKDRYFRITKHIFVVKKKKAYLSTHFLIVASFSFYSK